MDARWVGISGKMGAGKDHLFRTLQQYLPVWVMLTRISFADTLRREIEETLGLDPGKGLLWTKPYPEEVRRLLQWWGTDLRRAADPDYWVKKGRFQALRTAALFRTPVFTDVRFPNEANMIAEHGGVIVRVEASYDVRKARLGIDPPDHESETAMDFYPYFDFIIDSNYDDSTYYSNVERLARLVEG